MNLDDKRKIDHFLNKLQVTTMGCAIVVNIYHSYEQKLVSIDFIREFLLDCVQTMAAKPSVDALIIFQDVCNGYGFSKKHYLRQCKYKCK